MNAEQILRHFFDCRVIESPDQLPKTPPDVMAHDTETTGTDRLARIFGNSLCYEMDGHFYVAWARRDNKFGWKNDDFYNANLKLIQRTKTLVAHVARFDIRMIRQTHGVDVSWTDCTYTMSRIINDRRTLHGLKETTEWLCPELSQWSDEVEKARTVIARERKKAGHTTAIKKADVTYDMVPDEIMGKYAMLDSFMCLMLHKKFWPTIQSTFMEAYEREKKVYNLVNTIEDQGLHFSARKALRHVKEMDDEAGQILDAVRATLVNDEFNPNSPSQVLAGLRFLGVPDTLLRDKGKVTTAADILRQNLGKFNARARKFTERLLDYRALTKLAGTYLLPLADRAAANNGYIHCEINPTDARTGRMASRNPNLQNIPRPTTGAGNPVRECFTCRADEAIYYFDNEQMELAYFGMLTGCDLIVNAYANGEDLHMATARQVYGPNASKEQRQGTKAINFGIIYGQGIRALAMKQGWTMKEAHKFLEDYHNGIPEIKEYQDRCEYELRRQGYVEDFWGRRYHIPVREAYKAVNALVQGGCASAFKEQLLAVADYHTRASVPRHWRAKIIMPVHDELQNRLKRGIVHSIEEKIYCNDVIRTMSEIPQLLDRGLRMRISCERTVTSWAKKRKVKL